MPGAVDDLTALALAAGDGDRVALGGVRAASQAEVWRLCAHLTDRDAADDVTQDAYIAGARLAAIVPGRLVGSHVAAVDRPSGVRRPRPQGAAPPTAARRAARPSAVRRSPQRSTASSSSTCSLSTLDPRPPHRLRPHAAPRTRVPGRGRRRRRPRRHDPFARCARPRPTRRPVERLVGRECRCARAAASGPRRPGVRAGDSGKNAACHDCDRFPGPRRRRRCGAMYDFLFGPDRDPVAEPGTASGTPGDWWTVFALCPRCSTTRSRASSCTAAPSGVLDPEAARARPVPRRMGERQPVRVLAALQGDALARDSPRSRSQAIPFWRGRVVLVADRAGRARVHRLPRATTADAYPTGLRRARAPSSATRRSSISRTSPRCTTCTR